MTAQRKPALEPTAQVLREAVERSGLRKGAIAKALNVSPSGLSLWLNARGSVSPKVAKALGTLLHVDPARIVSKDPRVRAGRPIGAGPAARAVALLEARAPVLTAQPVNGVQRTARESPGVFRMEVRGDGTMAVWVQTVLPLKRGVEFTRWLLEFGVLPEAPSPD